MTNKATPVPSMQRWEPMTNARDLRRLDKTAEELGELAAVIARAKLQGWDGVDPKTGKTNRVRFDEETADVIAQINCNFRAFDPDVDFIDERVQMKEAWMAEWEAHYAPPEDGLPKTCPACGNDKLNRERAGEADCLKCGRTWTPGGKL